MKQLHYVLLPLIILTLFALTSCAAKRTATDSHSAFEFRSKDTLQVRTIRDSVILHVRDTTILRLRDSLVITERITECYDPQSGTLLQRDIDRRTLQLRDSLATLSHRLDSLSAHRRDTLSHTNHHIESSSISSSSKVAPTPNKLLTFLVLFALAYLAVCAYQAYRK